MGRDVGGLERSSVTFDLGRHRIVEANGRLDPIPQLLLAVGKIGRRHDCPPVHRDIALRRNLHLVDGFTERRPQRDAVFVAGALAIGDLAEGELRDRVAGFELVEFRAVLIQPDLREQIEVGLEIRYEFGLRFAASDGTPDGLLLVKAFQHLLISGQPQKGGLRRIGHADDDRLDTSPVSRWTVGRSP